MSCVYLNRKGTGATFIIGSSGEEGGPLVGLGPGWSECFKDLREERGLSRLCFFLPSPRLLLFFAFFFTFMTLSCHFSCPHFHHHWLTDSPSCTNNSHNATGQLPLPSLSFHHRTSFTIIIHHGGKSCICACLSVCLSACLKPTHKTTTSQV